MTAGPEIVAELARRFAAGDGTAKATGRSATVDVMELFEPASAAIETESRL